MPHCEHGKVYGSCYCDACHDGMAHDLAAATAEVGRLRGILGLVDDILRKKPELCRYVDQALSVLAAAAMPGQKGPYELALRNVRALAKRLIKHPDEAAELAPHLLRFCDEVGVVDRILREET